MTINYLLGCTNQKVFKVYLIGGLRLKAVRIAITYKTISQSRVKSRKEGNEHSCVQNHLELLREQPNLPTMVLPQLSKLSKM